MSHLSLVKTQAGFFPADAETEEVTNKVKIGGVIHGDFKQMRNPQFHRKFFAMLNVGFGMWVPGEFEHNGKAIEAEPNFESFREWSIIKSGFYIVRGYPDGSARAVAKSISFAKMDNIEFERVYSTVLDVILRYVCPDVSKPEYEQSVESLLRFD